MTFSPFSPMYLPKNHQSSHDSKAGRLRTHSRFNPRHRFRHCLRRWTRRRSSTGPHRRRASRARARLRHHQNPTQVAGRIQASKGTPGPRCPRSRPILQVQPRDLHATTRHLLSPRKAMGQPHQATSSPGHSRNTKRAICLPTRYRQCRLSAQLTTHRPTTSLASAAQDKGTGRTRDRRRRHGVLHPRPCSSNLASRRLPLPQQI